MKNNVNNSSIFLSVFFIIIFNSFCFIFLNAQEWYAQISPSNNEYIEVTIDLENAKKNLIFENVFFEASFYDNQNNLIKKQTYQFTDDKNLLESGSIYQRNFIYKISSAYRVKGEMLNYEYRPIGLKSDDSREGPGFVKKGKVTSNQKEINNGENENLKILGEILKSKISMGKNYRINNRWKKELFIHIENSILECSEIKKEWWSPRWQFEPIQGTTFFRIRNVWKNSNYIHIQNGKLECGEINKGWWSARWELEPIKGTTLFRIRNVWKKNNYIHIENNKLECGEIKQGWWSARWILEPIN